MDSLNDEYKPFSKCDDLPKEIIEAYENDKLAIFIGAGISRLAGCKSWQTLGSELIEKCYKKGFINFRIKEKYCNCSDNKKVITIAHNIFQENNSEEEFFEIFNNALVGDKSKYEIYNRLYDICKVFITTNADEIFEEIFINKNNLDSIKYKVDDLNNVTLLNLPRKTLFEIHGRKSDRNSLVFTADQYVKRYTDERFQTFLSEIFNHYVVLFVGYGLSEFELLDYVITKGNNFGKNHFLLLGKYKSDDLEFKYESSYYNTLNIKTIPFELDEIGYEQQRKEIESLHKKLFEQSKLKSEEELTEEIKDLVTLEKIEEFIDKYFKIYGMLKTTIKCLYIINDVEITERIFIALYKRREFSSEFIFSCDQDNRIKWNYFDILHLVFSPNSTKNSEEKIELLKDLSENDDFKTPYITNSIIEFIFTQSENIINQFREYIKQATIHEPSVVADTFEKDLYKKIINFSDKNLFFFLFDCTFAGTIQNGWRKTSVFGEYYLANIIDKYFDSMVSKYKDEITEHLIEIYKNNFGFEPIRFDKNNKNLFKDADFSIRDNYRCCLGNLIYHLSNDFPRSQKVDAFINEIEMIEIKEDLNDKHLYDYTSSKKIPNDLDFSQLLELPDDDEFLPEINKNTILKHFEAFEESIIDLSNLQIKSYKVKREIIACLKNYYEEKSAIFGIEYILDFLEKDFFDKSFTFELKKQTYQNHSMLYYYAGSVCDLITCIFNRPDRNIETKNIKRFLQICLVIYSQTEEQLYSETKEKYMSYLSTTLNTNSGKATESIVCIAVWYFSNRKLEESNDILKFFEDGFKNNHIIKTAVFFQYFKFFFKFQKNWIDLHLKDIFIVDRLSIFIENFWYGHQGFYKELFVYLDEINVLRLLVENPPDSMITDIVIFILTSAYLQNVNLSYSLLDFIKNDNDKKQFILKVIEKVNRSIKTDKENDFDDNFKEKLKELQGKIYEEIEKLGDKKYQSLCAIEIVKWLIILNNVADVKEQFDLISVANSIQYDLYDLVKAFLILADDSNNVLIIIKILYSFAEKQFFIEYPSDAVKELFKKLYKANPSETDKLLKEYFYSGYLTQNLYEEIIKC